MATRKALDMRGENAVAAASAIQDASRKIDSSLATLTGRLEGLASAIWAEALQHQPLRTRLALHVVQHRGVALCADAA